MYSSYLLQCSVGSNSWKWIIIVVHIVFTVVLQIRCTKHTFKDSNCRLQCCTETSYHNPRLPQGSWYFYQKVCTLSVDPTPFWYKHLLLKKRKTFSSEEFRWLVFGGNYGHTSRMIKFLKHFFQTPQKLFRSFITCVHVYFCKCYFSTTDVPCYVLRIKK